MIATTRELLRLLAKHRMYDDGVLDVLVSIDDQTDHITLRGFGDFNLASPRAQVVGELGKASSARSVVRFDHGNSPENGAEVEEIFQEFRDAFDECRRIVRRKLTSADR